MTAQAVPRLAASLDGGPVATPGNARDSEDDDCEDYDGDGEDGDCEDHEEEEEEECVPVYIGLLWFLLCRQAR